MTARLERRLPRRSSACARFRGHFYNWYDLHDLRVLEPAYISTVDSGNLAGHLIALRQACSACSDEPAVDARVLARSQTALALAESGSRAAAVDRTAYSRGRRAVTDARGGRDAAATVARASTAAARRPPLDRRRSGARARARRARAARRASPRDAIEAVAWLD